MRLLYLREVKIKKTGFTEVGRLKGPVGQIKTCSFSEDGKYMITGGEDRTVRVWSVDSYECNYILRGHISTVIDCHFSQDGRQIVSIGEDNLVLKWNYSEDNWHLSFELNLESVTNCGFVPSYEQMIFIGKANAGLFLCNAATGRHMQKLHIQSRDSIAKSYKFNSDGKQTAVGSVDGAVNISDFIRNHLIKYPNILISENSSLFDFYSTKLIVAKDSIIGTFDTASVELLQHKNLCAKVEDFNINPVATEQLAVLLDNSSIVFWSLSNSKRKYESTAIKGTNQQGLSLCGVNLDNSNELSEKNVLIFNQEGDYIGFRPNEIRELLLIDPKQTLENVTVPRF